MEYTIGPDIAKSQSDDRAYRHINLTKNGLKCILVSHPDVEKAGAAMSVAVGQFQDPDEVLGLAHYVEHMMFLGSKKYPDDSFNKFLSTRSGHTNAGTAVLRTTYAFDIVCQHLSESLERFASFFKEPSFNPSHAEREINAIHSEFLNTSQNDGWRLMMLMRLTANPKHPSCRMTIGNNDTLSKIPKEKGTDINEALRSFYSSYYSAKSMCLVVLGKEDLDTLSSAVVREFSDIPSQDVSVPPINEPMMTNKELQEILFLVPVKDIHRIEIWFPIPDELELWREGGPDGLVEQLIGNEAPGSLLEYLKQKGYADWLVAGPNNFARGSNFFNIKIGMTEEGVSHWNDIILTCFEYITMLKSEGIPDWCYDELKDLKSMHFRFLEKDSTYKTVSKIADVIANGYPAEHALDKSFYCAKRPSNKSISEFLGYLVPNNARILACSKTFESLTDLVEPFYSMKYHRRDFTPEELVVWSTATTNSNLHLPARNEFIPTNFDLYHEPLPPHDWIAWLNERPELVRESELCRVWFKPDKLFKQPKADVTISIIAPSAYQYSPRHLLMTHLLSVCLTDALGADTYNALLAGAEWNMIHSKTGIELKFAGFNHKLPILIQKIFNKLVSMDISGDRFMDCVDVVKRKLENYKKGSPHSWFVHEIAHFMEEPRWSTEEQLAGLNGITIDEIKAHGHEIISTCFIEMFVHGNVTRNHAIEYISNVLAALKNSTLSVSRIPKTSVIDFTEGSFLATQERCKTKEDKNSAAHVFWEIGPSEPHIDVCLSLFSHLVHTPVFTELRTKKQLGYVIWSGARQMVTVKGFYVFVESPTSNPLTILYEILRFVKSLREVVTAIPDDEFNTAIAALIQRRLDPPQNQMQSSSMVLSEIVHRQYMFDRRLREIEVLKEITRADVLAFADRYIFDELTSKKVAMLLFADRYEHMRFESWKKTEEDKGILDSCWYNCSEKEEEYKEAMAKEIECPFSLFNWKLVKDISLFKQNSPKFPASI